MPANAARQESVSAAPMSFRSSTNNIGNICYTRHHHYIIYSDISVCALYLNLELLPLININKTKKKQLKIHRERTIIIIAFKAFLSRFNLCITRPKQHQSHKNENWAYNYLQSNIYLLLPKNTKNQWHILQWGQYTMAYVNQSLIIDDLPPAHDQGNDTTHKNRECTMRKIK